MVGDEVGDREGGDEELPADSIQDGDVAEALRTVIEVAIDEAFVAEIM